MKIAYMIMAHTDPAQLQRLVTALHVDDVTHFYVHIDSKSDAASFESALANESSVTICKSRVNVSWGGVFASGCVSVAYARCGKLRN